MKNTILLYFLAITTALAQVGLEDQYQFNMLSLNPAFTGERGNFGVSGLLGQQFNGTFRPNQISQLISMDGKLGEGKSAIGFQGFRSNITGFTNNGMALSYNYLLPLNDNLRINFGISGGFMISPNFIGNVDILQRFNPFGGPGMALFSKAAFLGVAAPTLLGNTDVYSTLNKNIKISGGYRFGNYENIGVNLSGLASLATRSADASAYDVNLKIWLGNKIGLGGSYRTQSKLSKIIPSLQMRASETSTIGLSYDAQPLLFTNRNTGSISPQGVFQLLYRYDVFDSGEKSPFLNQF
jgi:type IX secretion system PorP/SprF family membrane protein